MMTDQEICTTLRAHYDSLIALARSEQVAALPTPFSLFEADRIRANCLRLRSIPRPDGLDLQVHFATKSLYLVSVLDWIAPLVDCFDVQSRREIDLLPKGAPVSFHSPVLDDCVIEDNRVQQISLNSVMQVERALRCRRSGIRWGLRIALSKHTSSQFVVSGDKFGVAVDDAAEAFVALQDRSAEPVFIHHHSHARLKAREEAQRTTQAFADVVRSIEARSQVAVEAVNLGGGWDGAFEARCGGDSIEVVLEAQLSTVREELPNVQSVIIEPGRSLVEDSCIVVTTVCDVFERDTTTVVVVDVATGFLVPVPLAHFRILHLGDESSLVSEPREVVIVDGTCSSRGRIAALRTDRVFQVSDRLAVVNTGAYTYSLAGGFYAVPPPAYAWHGQLATLTDVKERRISLDAS